jgi:hypothetical protein
MKDLWLKDVSLRFPQLVKVKLLIMRDKGKHFHVICAQGCRKELQFQYIM